MYCVGDQISSPTYYKLSPLATSYQELLIKLNQNYSAISTAHSSFIRDKKWHLPVSIRTIVYYIWEKNVAKAVAAAAKKHKKAAAATAVAIKKDNKSKKIRTIAKTAAAATNQI